MSRLRWIVVVGCVAAGLAFFAVQGRAQGPYDCERKCVRLARQVFLECRRNTPELDCYAQAEAALRTCLDTICWVE